MCDEIFLYQIVPIVAVQRNHVSNGVLIDQGHNKSALVGVVIEGTETEDLENVLKELKDLFVVQLSAVNQNVTNILRCRGTHPGR